MRKFKQVILIFLMTFIFCPFIVKAATYLEASTQHPTVGSNVYILVNAMYGDMEIREFYVRIKYDEQYFKFEDIYWTQSVAGTYEVKDGYIYIRKDSTTGIWKSGNQIQFKFSVLKEGLTKFEIDAVNQNGNVEDSYYTNGDPIAQSFAGVTVDITKPSDDTFIGYLGVEGFTISPTFKKTTYDYNLVVPPETTEVTITAKKGDSKQTITGTGVKKLSYGLNRVRVVVEAQSGSSRTYQIMINRKDNRTGDTSLKSILVTNTNIVYEEGKTEYNATVSRDIDSILITAQPNDSNATVTGTGRQQLQIGKNTFKLYVESSGGRESTYTINITRSNEEIQSVSQSSKLRSLKVNNLSLDLSGDNKKFIYGVAKEYATLNIEAIPESNTAIVETTGNKNLLSGVNVITIKVTENNDEFTEYTILVYKNPQEATVIQSFDNINFGSNLLYQATLNDSHIVPRNAIELLKESEKKLYYNVIDIYGGLLYQIVLNNTVPLEDIDVSFNEIEGKTNNYQTKLPKDSQILLYLDDAFANDMDVKIYSYDENGVYSLVTEGAKVTNGYINFTTDGNPYYVVTLEELIKQESAIEKFFNNFKFIIIGVVILVIVIIIILKKNKKSSKTPKNEPLY